MSLLDDIKEELESSMTAVLQGLKAQLLKVRSARATSNILDGIKVDYYGTPTPLVQLGHISTPEARLLQIQPFDKTAISSIEKAILSKNLGLNPSNDGNLIRIPFPALTEEKRKELVRNVRKFGEDTKIQIRNLRRDGNDKIKKAEKDKEITEDDLKKYQSEIQVVTDGHITKVDGVIKNKEEELLTV